MLVLLFSLLLVNWLIAKLQITYFQLSQILLRKTISSSGIIMMAKPNGFKIYVVPIHHNRFGMLHNINIFDCCQIENYEKLFPPHRFRVMNCGADHVAQLISF